LAVAAVSAFTLIRRNRPSTTEALEGNEETLALAMA
jgi:hypothetical protein